MGSGGGRRGGRGRRGVESRLMTAAAASAAMQAARHHRSKWWSLEAIQEKLYCQDLYRYHMMVVKPLGIAQYGMERQQKLEELCDQFKPLWSKWWTDGDDRRLCSKYSDWYQRCESDEGHNCESYKEKVERLCTAKQSPPRRPSLFTDQVIMYCV